MERFRPIENIKFAGRVVQDTREKIVENGMYMGASAVATSEFAAQGKPVAVVLANAVGIAIYGAMLGRDLRANYRSRKEIENYAGPITADTVGALIEEIDTYIDKTTLPPGRVAISTYTTIKGDNIHLYRQTEIGLAERQEVGKYQIQVYKPDSINKIVYESVEKSDGATTFILQGPVIHGDEEVSTRELAEFEGRQLVRILKTQREEKERRASKKKK